MTLSLTHPRLITFDQGAAAARQEAVRQRERLIMLREVERERDPPLTARQEWQEEKGRHRLGVLIIR
jgi:hypothetical protein